jgi:hypothetical protein
MPHRWGLALAVSVVLAAAAPFAGEAQRWLERSFGAAYVPVVNVVVAALTGAAVVAAAVRIRERRLLRYGLILMAVAIAAAYAARTGLASARSNAVERFHFVEYGAIAWLFYRAAMASTGAADGGRVPARAAFWLLASPVACALAVATGDEWLQHLAPRRIGEVRDIFMNVAAIGCGLLVSVAVVPLGQATPHGVARARRAALIAGAACVAGIAAFVVVVHTGERIEDDEVVFLSRYDAGALRRRTAGAPDHSRLAGLIEDQYVTEAVWHVQARNASWEAGDIAAAWGENRILEKYYAPVLAAGQAWPPDQRADAERRGARHSTRPYRSHAERIPIYALRR